LTNQKVMWAEMTWQNTLSGQFESPPYECAQVCRTLVPRYAHTYLLFWAEDTQVLLTSAVLEFGTFFLWVQEALEKKESYLFQYFYFRQVHFN